MKTERKMKNNLIAAFDQNMHLLWSTFHGSDKYDIAGGISVSESNDRLVIVGTGNHGFGEMDVASFDPWDYSNSSYDYFQAGPITGDANVNCGEGAIFDISQLETTVSIHESSPTDFQILISPNPTTQDMNIQSAYSILDLRISDISGKIVYQKSPNQKSVNLNISSLKSGVYIIVGRTDRGVFSRKMVKL